MGLEPNLPECKSSALAIYATGPYRIERYAGFEPAPEPWKGPVLPLTPVPQIATELLHSVAFNFTQNMKKFISTS